MSNRFTKAALLTGTFMAGAMAVSPVYAQTGTGRTSDTDDATDQDVALQAEPTNETGELIVVTGSRIARRNVETAAPIAVVQDEEFKLSGTVNVESVINTLPQVVPGLTSASNNPGTGTATLNLRGLGSTRTLVLVNGRRYMFYDTTQQVDLNTIPSFLIDSVDVVTGGASAVYGSDALAGVVNFRLRDVDGVEAGGQYALTDRGDGASYQVHGAIGTSFGDGRGNATVFAEYYNRKSVFQGDREFSRSALGDGATGLIPGGSSTPPEGRVNVSPSTVVVNGVTFPLAQGLTLDDAFFTGSGVARPRVGTDLYNYAPANYLQIPQERYLLGGFADYDIGGGHTLYTEVTFVNNRVATELAATPVTGTFNLNIATVSPFLSPALRAELQTLDARETAINNARTAAGLAPNLPGPGVVSAFIQRRVTETGSRNSLDERNAFRVLGGVNGPINDFLRYDAHYFYARTRNANVQAGNISRSAFQRGLDGTGTPINIFGPNTLTPAQVAAISILAQNGDISTLEVANATISGTLGDFAIGTAEPIGFALGTEYRKQGSEFIPDTALSSGDVIGFNAGQATAGAYDVKEVFGELNVPLEFGGMRLELNGAARYSDYSLDAVGGVWTYAGGVEFQPIPDVTLRGQYQRAIRAPNVAALFGGQSIGFPPATDPCAVPTLSASTRAFCVANGVPANLVGTGAVQLNPQIAALFGGNPDLGEETSDSFTAGIVLQPRFIPGLVITADYFDITIDDAIATAGGGLQNALNICYTQVQNNASGICQPFVGLRNSSGQFTTDGAPLISNANIAELGVSGVDVEVSYGMDLPFSLMTDTGSQRLQLSFLGTWTDRSYFVPIVGLDTVNECAGRFGLTCGEPTPEYKWTSRASFIDGPLTTSIRWRHLSSVRDDDDGTDFIVERVPSYDIFDLSFAFDITEQFSMSLGVNNIFDKLPTLIGSNQEQANTYPSTYDTLGRRYFVSGSFKF